MFLNLGSNDRPTAKVFLSISNIIKIANQNIISTHRWKDYMNGLDIAKACISGKLLNTNFIFVNGIVLVALVFKFSYGRPDKSKETTAIILPNLVCRLSLWVWSHSWTIIGFMRLLSSLLLKTISNPCFRVCRK